MRSWGWGRRLLVAAALVVAGWASWPGLQLLRFVLDDQALDEVVVAVLLDWRDFGEEEARERLALELDRRGLAARLPAQACTLRVGADARSVACAWEVGVDVPLAGRLPLAFSSEASLDGAGAVRR